jgi:ABC-type multidrug transport system ATPase subunit
MTDDSPAIAVRNLRKVYGTKSAVDGLSFEVPRGCFFGFLGRLMKEILLDQVRQGATIFLTSHVLEVVERLCDRVAIIHDGKLVIDEPMASLRSGNETLEEIFVRVVGAARAGRPLDWLS